MSKAAYWQRGESLDYTNSTDKIIEANTVVELAERIGIAGTDIAPGKKGDLHVSGVFEFAKTSTNEIPMGTSVNFDGNGITEASGGTPAGFAAATAGASDTTILVKIG
jgi:predicted RecA/RadA family phage recombinase